MSSSSLRVSNVTVDKAVRTAETKIVNELPVATAVNDESFINFNDISPIDKQRIITQGEAVSMAKSGLVIVDYTRPADMTPSDPFTLLFGMVNTQVSADILVSIFNLSSTTPSRLIRVIRTGINVLASPDTILGTTAVVAPTVVKYVYFQVNGIDGTGVVGGDNSTKTPAFVTNSDWSFVVSLKSDKRVCFNVLV